MFVILNDAEEVLAYHSVDDNLLEKYQQGRNEPIRVVEVSDEDLEEVFEDVENVDGDIEKVFIEYRLKNDNYKDKAELIEDLKSFEYKDARVDLTNKTLKENSVALAVAALVSKATGTPFSMTLEAGFSQPTSFENSDEFLMFYAMGINHNAEKVKEYRIKQYQRQNDK